MPTFKHEHVHQHYLHYGEQDKFAELLFLLLRKVNAMADTLKDVVELAKQVNAKTSETKVALEKVATAVNDLEGKITAGAPQADIDSAMSELKAALATATSNATSADSAAADASDGVDEAAGTPPEGGGGEVPPATPA